MDSVVEEVVNLMCPPQCPKASHICPMWALLLSEAVRTTKRVCLRLPRAVLRIDWHHEQSMPAKLARGLCAGARLRVLVCGLDVLGFGIGQAVSVKLQADKLCFVSHRRYLCTDDESRQAVAAKERPENSPRDRLQSEGRFWEYGVCRCTTPAA